MTETSPSCTTGIPKAAHATTVEDRIARKTTQGRVKYGVEVQLRDDDGKVLPFDGVAQGDLFVRGPWIASGYFEDDEATAAAVTDDGWFRTGDIASIDSDGYVTIRDRSKDVIKSGGEWISSIDLENVAVAHPGVAEAAAIGVPHPTWAERPVLVIVPKDGNAPTKAEMLEFLTGKVAKWWLPDDVLFVKDLPHTATGKVSKKTLRERHAAGELV
jgi:fatty-acyl-CoA synthase